MTEQPFMPAPGSFALVQGADTPEEAHLIGEWARSNNLDPGSIDGAIGVRADYAGRQLIWFDRLTGERHTAPMLVEPSAEVLNAGRARREDPMTIEGSGEPHDIEFVDGSLDGTRETADPDQDQDLPLIPGDDSAPDAKPDDYYDPQIYPES